MRMSDRGVAALLAHEGIVPGPYLDSEGNWTFGVGHTAQAGLPDPAKMPRGIPADLEAALREVFRVFRQDLLKYETEVLDAVRVPLAQHEFDALVSFHFNTGGIGRARLTSYLNADDRKSAANAFFGWMQPSSIADRRRAEERLFRTGFYPSSQITVWGVTTTGRVVWSPIRRLLIDEALAFLRPAPAVVVNPFAGLLAFLSSIFSRKGA
ncbi:lysozyme [Cereibacter sphaeroides]|uniref:lysozyme n=1 Tax=Cereibacter sphaeroides TaxID=1063 RepID=UPI0000663F81|nr:Phage-related lysozyme (muraminidase)-like [Cereibacter sphaeroides ATCC 17029]